MRMRHVVCCVVLLFAGVRLHANPVYTVCPSGCAYTTLQAAVTAAAPQSTITLAPGVYNQCAVIPRDKPGLVLRGPGAHLQGKQCAGKGALVVQGEDVTIDGLECSRIAVADGNGACVRNEAATLTIRHVYFHDAQTAYLGGKESTSGIVTIEDSRFERNGKDGTAHNIYIAKRSHHAIVQRNVISDIAGGHGIKCGAQMCELIDNKIGPNLNGKQAVGINVQLGGKVTIRGGVVEKGPNAVNPWILTVANEPGNTIYPAAMQDIVIDGVTIINDRATGTPVSAISVCSGGPTCGGQQSTPQPVIPIPIKATNLTLVGVPRLLDPQSVGAQFTETGTKIFKDRAAAGLGPFPAIPGVRGITESITAAIANGVATITYTPNASAAVFTAPFLDRGCNTATSFACVWALVQAQACGQVVIPATSKTVVRVDAGGPSPMIQVP